MHFNENHGDEQGGFQIKDRKRRKFDPARGEGLIAGESSSEAEAEQEEIEDEDDDSIDENLELVEDVSDDDGLDLEEPTSDAEDLLEEREGEFSRRFAVVNLDWDHVRSVDLYHILSSFVPMATSGRVLNVTVFPSELGKERMADESIHGPPKEIFMKREESPQGSEVEVENENDEDEEEMEARIRKELVKQQSGEDFDKKKLRRYQLDRLKYFYAVVECDSTETAKYIYTQCDGAEYETSGNSFDIRFIPDEMQFDEDEARDTATETKDNYDPDLFQTSALQHSHLRFTWDETDPSRIATMRKAFNMEEHDALDLSNIIGSDSSGNESVAATVKMSRRQKYRKLLNGDGADEGEEDLASQKTMETMEVVFRPEDEFQSTKDDETTMQSYKRKEREKKQKRSEKRQAIKAVEELAEEKQDLEEEEDLGFDDPFFENPRKAIKKLNNNHKEVTALSEAERGDLELLLMDDHATKSHQTHFNMAQIMKEEKASKVKGKKNKKKKTQHAEGDADEDLQTGFEPDVGDPRFQAVYQGSHFAIDPNHPRYTKSQTMSKLLNQVRSRNADR